MRYAQITRMTADSVRGKKPIDSARQPVIIHDLRRVQELHTVKIEAFEGEN